MSSGPLTVDGESQLEGAREHPRAGRRRMLKEPSEAFGGEDTAEPQNSPPPASKSGWGTSETTSDEPAQPFTGVSRRKAASTTFGEEQKGPDRRKHEDEGEADVLTEMQQVMEIPELDADVEEDITRQVAAPPRLRSNRVQTIKELDHDIQYSLPTYNDKEVDLSLLTCVLCPSEQVAEDDVMWEADTLLADVAMEINLENENMEKDKEKAEGNETNEMMPGEDGRMFSW
mmetsp:Transcript_28408/g.34498  ORF Transcript_28408/g.34498 Transcript_28408/m.34498 type:complete len:230 (-) Transcript_28408:645-1334(-)